MVILKHDETGVSLADLAREHGCSSAMIYQRRSKFGCMAAPFMRRMKELGAENARLKKMCAEERIRAEIRKKALEGKRQSHLSAGIWLEMRYRNMAYPFAWPVNAW